jgi:hypothetical protein
LTIISADGLELDWETVSKVARAKRKHVKIQLLAITPDELWFLTAWVRETPDGVRCTSVAGGELPPGIEPSDLCPWWRGTKVP